jgi:hypothetical protein
MHSTDTAKPMSSPDDMAAMPDRRPAGDTLLQLSRRLDWRFLLPNPELGRVACFGANEELLVSALQLFSASLTLVEPGVRPLIQDTLYDVVVAPQPSPDELPQAVTLVKPGGFLYVEARRTSAFKAMWRHWKYRNAPQASGWQHPRHYMRVIEGYGMVEIAAHWHWPGFTTGTEIIPLAEQTALLNILQRRQSSRRLRLKPLIGRWLLQSGGLMQLVRCFSIVARRPPVGSL